MLCPPLRRGDPRRRWDDSEPAALGAEIERLTKLQDVLLRVTAKRITWWDAAEIIAVTGRTVQRRRERLERDRYAGLADRRRGRPSRRRIPLAVVEELLRL